MVLTDEINKLSQASPQSDPLCCTFSAIGRRSVLTAQKTAGQQTMIQNDNLLPFCASLKRRKHCVYSPCMCCSPRRAEILLFMKNRSDKPLLPVHRKHTHTAAATETHFLSLLTTRTQSHMLKLK